MLARPSDADRRFVARFEAGEIAPEAFDHRGHLRLAYTYLCTLPQGDARERMRASIRAFLGRHGADPGKYHETLTMAWMDAVRHFMALAGPTLSFAALVEADARLLDKDIMLTHYSPKRLFSPAARTARLTADIEPIPSYR